MAPLSTLISRQYNYDGIDDSSGNSWWYYSQTAFIIKWVITAAIVIGFLVFFVGGYFHAQRRLKKGLPPLRYHKWLVPRKQRQLYPQHFPAAPSVYYHRSPYGHGAPVPLQNYGPPPPAYGENDYVPPYTPPQGGSKVNPDQHYDSHSGPSQPAPAASSYR